MRQSEEKRGDLAGVESTQEGVKFSKYGSHPWAFGLLILWVDFSGGRTTTFRNDLGFSLSRVCSFLSFPGVSLCVTETDE